MFTSPFIAVQTSFWPLLVSFILFSTMGNTVLWINLKVSLVSVLFPLLVLILMSFMWWKDVMRESLLGYHTHKLEVSLRVGMILFILSEVFFFVSFFWAFMMQLCLLLSRLGLLGLRKEFLRSLSIQCHF